MCAPADCRAITLAMKDELVIGESIKWFALGFGQFNRASSRSARAEKPPPRPRFPRDLLQGYRPRVLLQRQLESYCGGFATSPDSAATSASASGDSTSARISLAPARLTGCRRRSNKGGRPPGEMRSGRRPPALGCPTSARAMPALGPQPCLAAPERRRRRNGRVLQHASAQQIPADCLLHGTSSPWSPITSVEVDKEEEEAGVEASLQQQDMNHQQHNLTTEASAKRQRGKRERSVDASSSNPSASASHKALASKHLRTKRDRYGLQQRSRRFRSGRDQEQSDLGQEWCQWGQQG